MIYKEKEDCLFFYEPDSELNVLLLDKGRTAKPYITQEEFLRYFKELIGDKNVYFKFAVCKGASRFRFYKSCVEGDMDDDVFIERYVREHIIVNIYKATGI